MGATLFMVALKELSAFFGIIILHTFVSVQLPLPFCFCLTRTARLPVVVAELTDDCHGAFGEM